ncbi:MAG: hypothetical protein IK016_05695 [Lachnospiraceae bacterium]|nr:hypothetical protein [Lachnospiraceae bacterium]
MLTKPIPHYFRITLRELPCALLFSFFVCAGMRYRAHGTLFTGHPLTFLALWLLLALAIAAVIALLRIAYKRVFLGHAQGRELLSAAPGDGMPSAERFMRHEAETSGSAKCPAHPERSGCIHHRGRRFDTPLLCALMIFAAWLPYLLLRYPAAIDWDAYHQTAQGLGLEQMTSHWPPFVAFLLGRFAWFGITVFDSVNAGLFLFALAQTLLAVFVLTKSLLLIEALAGKGLSRFFLVLYMLSPLYAGFLTTVVKDALFSILVLWLFIEFVPILLPAATRDVNAAMAGGRMDSAERLVRHGAETTGSAECPAKSERSGTIVCPAKRLRTLAKLAALSFLVCITRNNGLFIVFTLWLGCAWRWLRAGRTSAAPGGRMAPSLHRALTITLAAVMALYMVYLRLWIPSLGIRPGSIKEALSIPFQQSARYMRDYPEDITEEEARLVDTVLDVNRIGELYNPLLSDEVKDTYRESARYLPGYLKAWLSMGLRHPLTYVDATLHNIYGFFDPFSKSRDFPDGVGRGALNTNPALQFTYPPALEKATDALQAFASFLESVPPFALFCNVPLTLWASFYLICECFRRRRARSLALPSAISLLILIASPTWYAGGIRYTLPLVLMLPVLLAALRRGTCGPEGL